MSDRRVFETCSCVFCFKGTFEMRVVEVIVRPPYGSCSKAEFIAFLQKHVGSDQESGEKLPGTQSA